MPVSDGGGPPQYRVLPPPLVLELGLEVTGKPGLGCLQTIPVHAGPIPACSPCSCLCRSGAVMQIQPCLCRSGPCFPRFCLCLLNPHPVYADYIPVCTDNSPCLQTLSLFTLTLTLLNSIPALFTQAPFCLQKPWPFAESQLPGTSSSQRAGFCLPCWPQPHRGWLRLSGEPAVGGRCWEPPAQAPAKVAPLLPRLWHRF